MMSNVCFLLVASMLSGASAQRGLSILRREPESLSYQTAYDESMSFVERPESSASTVTFYRNSREAAASQQRALKGNDAGAGKGHQKSKGIHTPAPTLAQTVTYAPTIAPTTSFSNQMEVKFFQLPASKTVFVNSSSLDSQQLGTVFIYNDLLYDQISLTQIDSSFVSGLCTRIQVRQDLGNGQFIVGAGQCSLTYTLVDANNNTATFNAAGEVFDQFGGVLAVQGGTAAFVGVYGEIQLSPVTVTNSSTTPFTGDFFTGATGYEANVTLTLANSNFTSMFA